MFFLSWDIESSFGYLEIRENNIPIYERNYHNGGIEMNKIYKFITAIERLSLLAGLLLAFVIATLICSRALDGILILSALIFIFVAIMIICEAILTIIDKIR